MKLYKNILNILCDSYLLWFNTIATKNSLPLTHNIFLFYCVYTKLSNLLTFYIIISLVIAFTTDYILKSKLRRKMLSDFLKIHATPELFLIFGNPGEFAAGKLGGKFLTSKAGVAIATSVAVAGGADHLMTHTGVYDSISYKINISTGLDPQQAFERLPNRHSLFDSIAGKSQQANELELLKQKLHIIEKEMNKK